MRIDSDQIYECVFREFATRHCFNGCVYQRHPQILATIFRNMCICDVFTAAVATENMSGFMLLSLQSFVSVLNQLTHCRQVPLFDIKSLD